MAIAGTPCHTGDVDGAWIGNGRRGSDRRLWCLLGGKVTWQCIDASQVQVASIDEGCVHRLGAFIVSQGSLKVGFCPHPAMSVRLPLAKGA